MMARPRAGGAQWSILKNLIRKLAKHDLRCAAAPPHIGMCGHKLRCAMCVWIHFGWNLHTLTESADSGFIPLFWCPQGPQGCLEKQNSSLISNLVLWCARIGPKSHNFWKTSELTRKTSKIDSFLMVFWSFWVLSLILAHQTIKFKLSGQFCFSRQPWELRRCQNSRMKPKLADLVTVSYQIWNIFRLFL